MAAVRLTEAEAEAKLGTLSGWSSDGTKLQKQFQFADFVGAMGFMTTVAFAAEKLNHHPNWSNVYRTVDVTLWTHDVGGLSALDFELAAAMDQAAGRSD